MCRHRGSVEADVGSGGALRVPAVRPSFIGRGRTLQQRAAKGKPNRQKLKIVRVAKGLVNPLSTPAAAIWRFNLRSQFLKAWSQAKCWRV